MRTREVVPLMAVAVLFCSVDPAFAQSKRVMVVQDGVVVKNRDGSKTSVPLGAVLSTTIEEDKWLWVPAMRGWAPKEDTIALDEAPDFFSKLIRKEPTAQAFHHRGLAYAATGNHRRAVDDFRQAIALEPRDAGLRVNRGNVYRDMEEFDKAISDYNRALELEPRNVIALNNRGLVFSAQQKYDQALLDFSAAIRIRPDYAEPHNHRGVVHWRQSRVAEARRDYEKAIRLKPSLAEPYYNLGAVSQAEGNYRESVAWYEKALERHRDFVAANNDLAWLLATCPDESIRNPDLAVRFATRACQLTNLKNANAIDTLAAALAANGQYDEAVRRVEQALRLSNEESKPQMNARKQLYIARQSFVDRG